MQGRIVVFGISVELLTSFLLYGLAPTDGVRVWYPSVWAYMGEHCLVWGVLIALFFTILQSHHVGEALTAGACLVSEFAATLFVWFVIPAGSGGVSKAWDTGRFGDYFVLRSSIWCVLAASASVIYWACYKRAKKESLVRD
jgi:hypothetical protein